MIVAHGIGGIQDLPVPTWLFYYAGGAVLALSFAGLAVLWKRPLLERLRRGRQLGGERPLLLSPLVTVPVQALSVFVFAVVWIAAAFGTKDPARNLAPYFVYIVFWLGGVLVSVLFGNVWAVLNPWRGVADGVAWASSRLGVRYVPPFTYSPRVGRWPAAASLLAFTALELTYADPDAPRVLALAILIYSWYEWGGMAAFGRRAWVDNADGFAVYFWLLAHMAPLAREGRAIVRRWPLTGLTVIPATAGTVACVAVALGSTGFDGFSRLGWWRERLDNITLGHLNDPGTADLLKQLMNVGGLLVAVIAVGLLYELAVSSAQSIGKSRERLPEAFVMSLVPIAFVYAVAHYFSYFVQNVQVAAKLASDPLGKGWDVLGTAGIQPDLGVLSPNAIWYVQVGALVLGHVAALAVAHDRAVSVFPRAKLAIMSQYPMLALMIVYTVGGMRILRG